MERWESLRERIKEFVLRLQKIRAPHQLLKWNLDTILLYVEGHVPFHRGSIRRAYAHIRKKALYVLEHHEAAESIIEQRLLVLDRLKKLSRSDRSLHEYFLLCKKLEHMQNLSKTLESVGCNLGPGTEMLKDLTELLSACKNIIANYQYVVSTSIENLVHLYTSNIQLYELFEKHKHVEDIKEMEGIKQLFTKDSIREMEYQFTLTQEPDDLKAHFHFSWNSINDELHLHIPDAHEEMRKLEAHLKKISAHMLISELTHIKHAITKNEEVIHLLLKGLHHQYKSSDEQSLLFNKQISDVVFTVRMKGNTDAHKLYRHFVRSENDMIRIVKESGTKILHITAVIPHLSHKDRSHMHARVKELMRLIAIREKNVQDHVADHAKFVVKNCIEHADSHPRPYLISKQMNALIELARLFKQ